MNRPLTFNGWPIQLNAWAVNSGRVQGDGPVSLAVGPAAGGYTNAQLDDTSGRKRRDYQWRPGVALSLRARFSAPLDHLRGTAGFGFWNAPFGDPRQRWPALPRAIWFFMGGPRSDFPINPNGPGRGFYCATLDAQTPGALALTPLAPAVVLLNRWRWFRRRVWPAVQRGLGISFKPLDHLPLGEWHDYRIEWRPDGGRFWVDGHIVHETGRAPGGPLGFVAWIDNQYLVVTPTGRMAAGTVDLAGPQGLEIAALAIKKSDKNR